MRVRFWRRLVPKVYQLASYAALAAALIMVLGVTALTGVIFG